MGTIVRVAVVAAACLAAWGIAANLLRGRAGGWSLPECPYRIAIVVNGAELRDSLERFPLKVRLDATVSHLWDRGEAGVFNVHFTDDSGRLLPYEIEHVDKSRSSLGAWVTVPRINAGHDTQMFMYYGGPVGPPLRIDDAVWDNSYSLVLTMNPAVARDSSVYRHDGFRYAAGDVAGNASEEGARFSSPNDCVSIPARAELLGSGDWTAEFRVRVDAANVNSGILSDGTGGRFHLYRHHGNFFVLEQADGKGDVSFDGTAIENGKWSSIAVEKLARKLSMFVNGSLRSVQQDRAPASPAGTRMTLGCGQYGPVTGVLKEVRFSKGIARSEEWLHATYLASEGSLIRVKAMERYPASRPE